ncbi:MAG: glycosyltransferase family 39 protein [Clostridiales bacterium]|jgi:4-amino-4-deoxy-L-arabinose transferase-like glycosyltransferase|nr:glycosyltransferase family 39 protein [Clostridiales bacterium]
MKQLIAKLKGSRVLFGAVVAVIVLAGLYYRLIFAYHVNFTNLHLGTELGHDEYYYSQMAVNLVERGVFGYMTDGEPNAYVTPGFPLFLALIYAVFGHGARSVLYVKIIQAVLSAISIFLVFLIGKKISDRLTGLIAAVMVAFYPPLIFYSRFLLTETLYIFMFLLYFLVQLTALEQKRLAPHFAAGLLAAGAILVRPLIFILLPLPYLYHYFTDKPGKRAALTRFGIFAAGFVTLMLPWWIRNCVTLRQFIFLCTQTNPFYYGIIENYTELPPTDNETADGIKLILKHLLTNPLGTVKWYTIGKINIIFGRQDYWIQQGKMYLASLHLLHFFIIVSGALGMLTAFFKKEIRLITLFLVLNVGFQLLFIPVERYAVPVVPLLAVCGAFMLRYLFRKPADGASIRV